MNKYRLGFTLIELMIVIAIIGIIASVAVPTYQDRIIRAQLTEAIDLTSAFKDSLAAFYRANRRFPANNQEAGIPSPENLIGNFVTGITIVDGAMHANLGNKVNAHVEGKTLSVRPAVVIGSPDSPISWLCGYADPVPGMRAAGENQTSVSDKFLPLECRRL